jgi:hypothetical protein
MGGAAFVDVGVEDTALELVRGRNSERAAALVDVPARHADDLLAALYALLESRTDRLLERRRSHVELYKISAAILRDLFARQLNRSISKRNPALELLKLVARRARSLCRVAPTTGANPHQEHFQTAR